MEGKRMASKNKFEIVNGQVLLGQQRMVILKMQNLDCCIDI